MNFKLTTLAALLSLALVGCGGGGSGSDSPTAPPVQGAPTQPTLPNAPGNTAPPVPTNPYTGEPLSTTPVTTVSGVVVSDVTVGAVITAYQVKDDGSNGDLIGTSTATGADGKFTLQFTKAPTGMVRFIATGGSFKSEADATTQANVATELVTPFVTPDNAYFVITPMTHMISKGVAYRAKDGTTLSFAYDWYAKIALSLPGANTVLKGDRLAPLKLLKTVPGSQDDTLNTYKDLLTALEWYGVRYDLPSHVVTRVLAANGEKDFPTTGLDGNGKAINVGQWSNGKFDETIPFTFDELTTIRNADGSVSYAADGTAKHDYAKAYISTNLIQNFYREAACANDAAKPALLQRYPADEMVFSDASFKTGMCNNVTKLMADLKARIATNQRSK